MSELHERVAGICLALPEVTERPSHSAPTWFVRDKQSFVMLWEEGHHHNDFPHLWCAAPPGAQQELVEAEPERFFRPPYVGGAAGWACGSTSPSTGTRSPASARRPTASSRPSGSWLCSTARTPDLGP